MESREELKKKIARCDKLGAKKFQPYVLKLEEFKFKVLKDIFPSLPKRYEKFCRKKRDKALKKAKTQAEKDKILAIYRRLIIDWRKELKREQNRNYHMDENKPTEFINYLNWNKKVHQKGLIKDGLLFSATVLGLALGLTPIVLVPALVYELISAFINFQCINIQNSHIYRYKLIEENLKKREIRKGKKLVENYGEAANVYSRSIANNKELPSIQDMINNVTTPEEARQLRQMLLEKIEKNNKEHPEQAVNCPVTTSPQVPETQTISDQNELKANLEIEKMVNEGSTTVEPVIQKHKGGK